jgi:hypothetical protein
LPKANQREHLVENVDVFDFEIGERDMEVLTKLKEGYSSLESLPLASDQPYLWPCAPGGQQNHASKHTVIALEHTPRMQRARLRSPDLDFWVVITVIGSDDRWLAVAWIGGDAEVGYGDKSASAVADALSSLGSGATADLMAGFGAHRT